MSAALGIASLVAFCLALFLVVPMLLVPLALLPLIVQRARHQRVTAVHPAPLVLDEQFEEPVAAGALLDDALPHRQDYSRAA